MQTIDMQGLMLEITIQRRRAADLAELAHLLVSLGMALLLFMLSIRVRMIQEESEASLNRSEAILAEVRSDLDRLESATFNLERSGGSR